MIMQSLAFAVLSTALAVSACRVRESQNSVRVIGGAETSAAEFPAALRFQQLPCSATKVSATHILTAAHCVVLNATSARLGNRFKPEARLALDQGYVQGDGTTVTIKEVSLHPDWIRFADGVKSLRDKSATDTEIFDYIEGAEPRTADLALITVEGEIPGQAFPILTATIAPEDRITLVGAGCQELNGHLTGNLSQVELEVETVGDIMITTKAGSNGQEKSACPGDSGGGAYVTQKTDDELKPLAIAGVSSFIRFTDVSAQTGIQSNLSRLDTEVTQEWLKQAGAGALTFISDKP